MGEGLSGPPSSLKHRVELPPEAVLFGQSERMRALQQKVRKVAVTDLPVLIQGESGTGKEVLAKLIHRLSPWSEGPFVKVSCAAIPGTLLESELFGYEKGAFTGAYCSKPGRVELANHGTLFLDEIGELDTSLQSKLLHLLQDGQFCRIGGHEEQRVQARVICATNRQLEQEIAARTFRPDLFYRINVISFELPPLRERSEDIPILIEYLLGCYNEQFGRNTPPPSSESINLLMRRPWEGNIRELENTVARYVILGSEEAFYSEKADQDPAAPSSVAAEAGSIPLKHMAKQATREIESSVILRALQANHWNRRQAARILNISYRALLYKIRQAGFPAKRGPKN